MTATTTKIDHAGRVVIPKAVRDAMRLEPGDLIEIGCANGEISIRPLRAESTLNRESGVWVYRSGTPVPHAALRSLVEQVRDERTAQLTP